jgi:hypothetical protein
MYINGQGVPQDYVIAYALYNLSATGDPSSDNPATNNRSNLTARMTPQQITAGQELTRRMMKMGVLKAIDSCAETAPKPSASPSNPKKETHMTTYTVTEREGCTLIFGSVPLSMVNALMSSAPDGSVVSDHLARLAGANLAFGLPQDVGALEARLTAEALEKSLASGSGLSRAARRWLAAGEQGLSSCSIFWRLTGVKPDTISGESKYHHPHDPSDLRRCLLLLDQVPEFRGRIKEMSGCSQEWNALVGRWDELVRLLESELPRKQWASPPRDAEAPKTYALMQQILRGARK